VIWLVWRRLRVPMTVAVALAVLLAVVALTGRSIYVSTAEGLGLSHCWTDAARGTCNLPEWHALSSSYRAFASWITVVAVTLPGVGGALAGATLFGGELGAGTHVYALTQSVRRLRWWASGLLVAGLPVAVATGVAVPVAASATWLDRGIDSIGWSPVNPMNFAISGLAPATLTVLVFCVAAAAGLLLRNVVGAIGIALLAAIVVPLVLGNGVRPNYLPPVTVQVDGPPTVQTMPPPGAAFPTSGYVTADGSLVPGHELVRADLADGCTSGPSPSFDCLADRGITGTYVSFQPAQRFWPMQLIDAVVVLALSALALGAGLFGLRRRVH
jgi:hypothetical protein